MKYAKKMTLVPYQEGNGDTFKEENEAKEAKRGNSIRKYALDRQSKLLNVILILAKNGFYDEGGKIKTRKGEEIDIIPLLLHCFSPGRNVRGLEDFVEILHKANVDPNLIINHNVRDMLISRSKEVGKRYSNETVAKTYSPSIIEEVEEEDEDDSASNGGVHEEALEEEDSGNNVKTFPITKRRKDYGQTQMTLRKRKRDDKEDEVKQVKFKKRSPDWDEEDSSF